MRDNKQKIIFWSKIVGLILVTVGVMATIVYSTKQLSQKADQIKTKSTSSDQETSNPDPNPQAITETPKPKTVYAEVDELVVEEVVSSLDIPWDITFTPDGAMLINQRSGKLMVLLPDGQLQTIKADLSDLSVKSELGLMGMVVDPQFSTNRRFYTCQGSRKNKRVEVIAWQLNDDYSQATRTNNPLVGGIPSASIHVGCRLRFDSQGFLWISTGDGAQGSNPQDINSLSGKVLRVNPMTGQGAPGNPFDDSPNSKLIYSFGHRNPQGLAWESNRQEMWLAEHGPDVDDEINLLVKGGNYGWDPVSKSNKYYQNVPMTDTAKYPNAVESKWSSSRPTLAISGAIFLEGSQWGDKEGWLAVASLKDSNLYLFNFDESGNFKDKFKVPELNGTYGRLRSPIIGPDNALYITTSNGNDRDFVLRVQPKTATDKK